MPVSQTHLPPTSPLLSPTKLLDPPSTPDSTTSTAKSEQPSPDEKYYIIKSLDRLRQKPVLGISSALYSGAKFEGKQKSGVNEYDVKVAIQHVNFKESFLCGYLHIAGLTEEYPYLTTFFEAEIIGPHHSFLTRKWDADENVDRQHWSRFAPFKPYEKIFNQDGFTFDVNDSDYLFMRWKEHFLVPDHKIQSINGASFAGFYYIMYRLSTGTISGLYYHRSSEWFQELALTHVPEKSFSSFEFR
ncbi:vacuolar import and degradation protein-domain-containing protein [Paraphysoderma sedebokerense]|nr:vacuolar import and degradation protein-domain-containing protein [Paraphysoderma sedebokerense]